MCEGARRIKVSWPHILYKNSDCEGYIDYGINLYNWIVYSALMRLETTLITGDFEMPI